MDGFQKANRSAFLNFLLAKYEMYTGKTRVSTLPYYLCIDPSDKCQLRCPTCPTGIENEGRRNRTAELQPFRRERRLLTPELLTSVLDELGEYLFLAMFYNYGEPLLNTNLTSFIRKAKEYQIDTEVHTNLSLPLSDERIDDLLSSGLDRILASIDGFSQETYQVHRVGGDLALVKRNLERLVGARARLGSKTHISWGFLVFSFNEHEIPAVQRYCNELGIEFHRRDAFVDNPAWLPSYRRGETPWLVPKEALLKKDATKGWSPLPGVERGRSASACGWHYGYSVVTGGGRVAPCCAVASDAYDLGELAPGQITFRDVWNNDNYAKSRAAFAGKDEGLSEVETVCTRCPYPLAIHHLYSVHDAKVVGQFYRRFAGSEPVLRRAFDLFSRIRYGSPMEVLCRGGSPFSLDSLFVGHESARDCEPFVRFVEANLLGVKAAGHSAS
jgi:MoaA/NifB/PqqE/SkfB family radical SAM enzyme